MGVGAAQVYAVFTEGNDSKALLTSPLVKSSYLPRLDLDRLIRFENRDLQPQLARFVFSHDRIRRRQSDVVAPVGFGIVKCGSIFAPG
jgi:hypothetical protein